MQPNKKEFENVLGIDGVDIAIERNGQQKHSEGDGIVVKGTIYLPANEGSEKLADNLRFGERVQILEERLSHNWGTYDIESHKVIRTWKLSANTWKEAFEEMEKECFGEVQKLRNALDARQKALEDAEKE
jgi:predicted HNH restriction endonuclease